MAPLLFVLLIVVPLAELWIILRVADQIGVLETIGLLIAVSLAGAWLLKQQGLATWQRFNDTLRGGGIPTKEATDGAMIMFGGALLLTPGFLTDVIGLLLLLPPTRAIVKRGFRGFFTSWTAARFGIDTRGNPRVYDTTARPSDRPPSPEPPSFPSSSSRDPDGDDSPGRG